MQEVVPSAVSTISYYYYMKKFTSTDSTASTKH